MAPKAPQKTQLDDNAEIYKRRDSKSEREKLSEMNFSEKVAYFKIYYLKKLLATLVIGGFLIWIIVTMVTPKPERVLNVAFVNYPVTQDYLDKMETDLSKLLKVDPKTQELFFDTSYDLLNHDYASAEKIMTYTYSGEIDIFIAPESQFLKYAFSETMWPLTDLLPTDLYSTFAPSDLFVCKTRVNDDEEVPEQATGPEGVYGIYLKDIDMLDIFDTATDPPVLGVVVTAKNKENAISYIKYLLNK
jgi:hypothetical protein